MAAAARKEAGLFLSINSADAEQARLFAANPNPKWVAPPGTSLHRYGTELALGPPAAYPWLQENHQRFGFVWRYKWEPCGVLLRGRLRSSARGARLLDSGSLDAGGCSMWVGTCTFQSGTGVRPRGRSRSRRSGRAGAG
jgi:D-alanyl-D-alanine carboxypeptidase